VEDKCLWKRDILSGSATSLALIFFLLIPALSSLMRWQINIVFGQICVWMPCALWWISIGSTDNAIFLTNVQEQRNTRLLGWKRGKKLSYLSKSWGALVDFAWLWCTPRSNQVPLSIEPSMHCSWNDPYQNHSISCSPDDPTCCDDNLSEYGATKACSSFNDPV
jgi:hypothetical protein